MLVGRYLAMNRRARRTQSGIETVEGVQIPVKWITEGTEKGSALRLLGIDPLSVIVTHLSEVIKSHGMSSSVERADGTAGKL